MPDKSNGDIAADGYNKYKVKNSAAIELLVSFTMLSTNLLSDL